MKITVWRWQFGPRHSAKKRARLGMDGHHAGCWINDYDCGAPDCPMARFSGRPEALTPGPSGLEAA